MKCFPRFRSLLVWVAILLGAGFGAAAQDAPPNLPPDPPSKKPVADEALDTTSMPDPDSAAEGSPVAAAARGSTLRIGTSLSVALVQPVTSGVQRNGDTVYGRLAAPVRTSSGATLPAGTRVAATVVSSAKAGTIGSAGVLSLQLTGIGGLSIVSDVLDFNGQEGHKDVADSAPQKGTEAEVQPGTRLQFRVLEQGPATGLVHGVPPAAGANSAAASGTGPGAPGGAATPGPGVNQVPDHGSSRPGQPPVPPR